MEIRSIPLSELPHALQEIPDPPVQLFARGSWPTTPHKYLAVVGSRALSPYGREACRTLIHGLSGYPISIISGLALGADSEAHAAALFAGMHTIAVPGSGLSDTVIYPRSNHSLAQNILASGGLLLSEHANDHRARPEDFPSRNRIMVGLAHAVLVIESGPQSGTLITARLAHEYNRDLLCVPHRIGDPHGFGAHLFLRLGATLVSETSHILEALGIEKNKESLRSIPLSKEEEHIYNLLQEPLSRDELVRLSGRSVADALTLIITLELKGVIREEFGAWRRV